MAPFSAMIQLVPQLKILLACQPVDFRKGIDSLVALCKGTLAQDPFTGTLFVFRNRPGTALKLLVYDGQGLRALPQAILTRPSSLVAPSGHTIALAGGAAAFGFAL